jgi:hypothetical protein
MTPIAMPAQVRTKLRVAFHRELSVARGPYDATVQYPRRAVSELCRFVGLVPTEN